MAILAVALFVPGCLGGGRDPSPTASLEEGPSTSPPGDTYWFVQVIGQEQDEAGPGVSCDRGFSYDVDVTARQLLMAPLWHPYDPHLVSSILAVDYDYLGGCPLAYGLHANRDIPTLSLGVIGDVRISIDPDTGDAQVHTGDDPAGLVKPGQQLRLSADGEREGFDTRWQAHGDVLIVNHGAWPRSGLVPTADGPSW